MGMQMRKALALLMTLIMFVMQLPTSAYAQDASSAILDWDSYVQSHPEEFDSADAGMWDQKFEALRKDLASAPYSRSKDVDDAPRYIVLAVDVSGSMSGRPISATRVAALRFCEQALESTSNTYIAVVSYESYAYTRCDFTRDINVLSSAISGIRASGGTSHYDGLYRANDLLEKITVPGASKNIVIMSDGLPQSGPTSSTGPYTRSDYYYYRYANAAVNYARELHKKYTIYSLGFFHSLYGSDLAFGRRFMQDLGNGGYWEVDDPDELEFTFGDIADEIISAKSGTFKYGGQINQSQDSTATYYYSDAYFDGDARDVNDHLATMSLCLELSAWTSKDAPNTETVWGTAEQRAQNAFALLNDIGFTNVETSPDMDDAPEMHSMGAVAAYKNIKDTTVIALAVRGGGYYSEWGGNFVLGTSGNHEGFENGRDEVLMFLKNYIADHKNDANGFKDTVKLWVVGYSRGGAVANMVAGYLTDNGTLSGVTFRPENIFAYTFEAPQGHVGSNSGYTNIHNYVYTYDIVPLVAPSDWGFNRYNSKDIELNVGIGSEEYEDLLKVVKAQYNKLLEGVPDCDSKTDNGTFALYAYAKRISIDVDVNMPQVDWDWFNTTVDFDNCIEITLNADADKSMPTQSLVSTTVFRLFNEIPGGRIGYVGLLEEPASELLAYFSRFKEDQDLLDVLYQVFVKDGWEGAKRVCAELFNPFAKNNAERLDNAAKALSDLIMEVTGIDAVSELVDYPVAVYTLAKALLEAAFDDIEDAASFVYYLCESHFQCHWPEIILAMVMARDDYYTDSDAFKKDYPESFRVIHINCPVDVTVYDERGAVLASIRGDQVTNNSSVHGAAITGNGTKQVILPSDAAYTIDIKATGDGEMDFSVLEFNIRDGRYNLLQNYQDVELNEGDKFDASIPAYILGDYYDAESDGSTTEYTLTGPNGYIAPTTILTGDEIRTATVSVSASAPRGMVTGGGSYLVNEYAQVEASALPTVEFLGWYENGKLVSNEAAYRFEVKDDVELVARFSEGDFHQLTVTSNEGGTAGDGTTELPTGMEIRLTAVPEEGYEFVCWESTSGEFSDATAAETVFTMPDEDATIKAVFKQIGMDLPDTGDHAAITLWIGLLMISGAAILVLMKRKHA